MDKRSETKLSGYLIGMRNYAQSLTGDAAEADDLVQKALLHDIEASSSDAARDPLPARLAALIYLQHASALNRGKLANLTQPGPDGLRDQIEERYVEQSGALRDLDLRFRSLPEMHQTVLRLVGVEGLTYREAADLLNVPIGTIMSRLSRARAALRSPQSGGDVVAHLRVVGGSDAA